MTSVGILIETWRRRLPGVAQTLRRAGLGLLLLGAAGLHGGELTDPAVDCFNVRVGTQTFAPRYHFTTNSPLVETAQAARAMGSDVIKFCLGKAFARQNGGALSPDITNLTALARSEPSCRRVLDMPFHHYVLWTYCFASAGEAGWKDGFSATERGQEYAEMFAFARYLLTHYNNSGKSFYLGHWEGDWYLLPNYNASTNPSPTAIHGMIDWLNTRQQAVDDAMRATPHTNVSVFVYTEVNRVRDAMLNGPANNQRLVNTVLPYVTNLDFVSWSSYDGMNLGARDLYATLDYLQAHLATNKTAVIPGRRVMIGEYGWGGSLSSDAQEPPTRRYLQRLLPWSPRFILFWEMYDNEGKAFWLIDRHGTKTPCYFLHERFLNAAKLQVARFKETQARLPDDAEFAKLAAPLLDHPLPPPPALIVSNGGATRLTSTSAEVAGTLTQGRYGDDQAGVWVFWGRQDGGTRRDAWDGSRFLGLNTHFNPATFSARLTNLPGPAKSFFRFYATNASDEAWAPATAQFTGASTVTTPPP